MRKLTSKKKLVRTEILNTIRIVCEGERHVQADVAAEIAKHTARTLPSELAAFCSGTAAQEYGLRVSWSRPPDPRTIPVNDLNGSPATLQHTIDRLPGMLDLWRLSAQPPQQGQRQPASLSLPVITADRALGVCRRVHECFREACH